MNVLSSWSDKQCKGMGFAESRAIFVVMSSPTAMQQRKWLPHWDYWVRKFQSQISCTVCVVSRDWATVLEEQTQKSLQSAISSERRKQSQEASVVYAGWITSHVVVRHCAASKIAPYIVKNSFRVPQRTNFRWTFGFYGNDTNGSIWK